MDGGGGSTLLLVVLVVAVWALVKVFPDWQEKLGLDGKREDSRGEDSAEEVLRQRFVRGDAPKLGGIVPRDLENPS